MKTRRFFLCSILSIFALAACSKPGGAGADPTIDYYTCTMHPSVHLHDPAAKCPICSMDLVPVRKTGAAAQTKNTAPELAEFHVPAERQQQIGVTYAAVERRPLQHTLRAVGMVAADKTRQWEFTARTDGYVQKLLVSSPGEPVAKDQPLLTIYSPDLLIAEHEYVTLLEQRDHAAAPEAKASIERQLDGGRRRLAQWNIIGRQVAELEQSRKPTEFLTLYSPFKGVVEAVPAEQGRRVMTGDRLVAVADLSVVWVWAEFYENELPMLAQGQKVAVTAKSYPGETFTGAISLVSPFLMEMQRTARVRIDLANPDAKLRPGMYVNVELAMDMGAGLTIPVSAVMPTGARTLVFLDKGEGRIEPRFIQLGGKFGERYEVKSGLQEGERVVASANFLIDAESKVQGAVKTFEEAKP